NSGRPSRANMLTVGPVWVTPPSSQLRNDPRSPGFAASHPALLLSCEADGFATQDGSRLRGTTDPKMRPSPELRIQREADGARRDAGAAGCRGSLAGSRLVAARRWLQSEDMTQALLVIDVQESFRSTERWSTISDPEVLPRVAELVDRFRDAGAPVFWI